MNDFKFVLRGLLKTPGFTVIAVLTLALGIGLVAVQFSLVNGALYSGLPFERSERIMLVERSSAKGRGLPTPAADFLFWREHQKGFGELAAQRIEQLEIAGEGIEARALRGAAFSSEVLKVLRAQPAIGRGFSAADEQAGAPVVVLLGHDVWKSVFGSDPGVVGRTLRVRGEPATVVGVMPPGFAYPVSESIWTNLRLPVSGTPSPADAPGVQVIGRLGDDTTLDAARAEFALLSSRAIEAAGTGAASAVRDARIHILPWQESISGGGLVVLLYSLLGVVGGVLALACLNVSNLLSARALQRGYELALRTALGATRGRIVRQMLAESVVISCAGAVGGVLLAAWIVPIVNRELAVGSRPFWIVIELDYTVLAATAAITLVVGVLAGLFPALRATRTGAGAMLKEAAGGVSNVRLGRMNRILVVAQVAMSCAVLVATTVLVDATRRLGNAEVPFDAGRVLSAQIRLNTPEMSDPARRLEFQRVLIERLASLPGVQTAHLTASYPFASARTMPVETPGAMASDGAVPPSVYVNSVTPGFFNALNFSLRSGREFTAADASESERVAVVTESFARSFWPGQEAVGQQLRFQGTDPAKLLPWVRVVGVVMDLSLDPQERRRGVHVPIAQRPPPNAVAILAAAGDPRLLERPLRETVRLLSGDVPVNRVLTLAKRTEDDLRVTMIFGRLALAFGASGLLLAAVGIYGVTAFAVQRRTREFGLRMALGARPVDVLRHVLGRGLGECAVGLVAGGLLGWTAGKPLLGVTGAVVAPPGALVYAIILASVAVTVLVALWIPARRATRVDPLKALRAD